MAQQTRIGPNEVRLALRSCRGAFAGLAAFSAGINLLMLTGSLYMLQVYDRVLTGRSVETLVVISLVALAAFGLQGVLEAVRSRMLARVGAIVDDELSGPVRRALTLLALRGGAAGAALEPQRDLDALRGFLSGPGPTAILDLPFMPIFLMGCFLLHPWLGWLALAGMGVILILTLLIEWRSRRPSRAYGAAAVDRAALAEAGRRNAEALAALGMRDAFARRYAEANARQVAGGLALADAAGGLGAAAKTFRFLLQSVVLGLGAYLAIWGQISAGAMIAASIMTARALAPLEIAVSNWKGFLAARQGARRLSETLPGLVPARREVDLPAPRMSLLARDLFVAPPGRGEAVVGGLALDLKAGDGLGIIGPSGSGKSSLARALVGVWPAQRGDVRLDGAPLPFWEPERLGAHLGYLPQTVELFDGTVAENIARLDPAAPSEAVLAAAGAAGAHAMILGLPDGYDTRVGEGGTALSGGQRQRIGLARALYGEPFLVVLDEPNANLDAEGEEALAAAIRSVRDRGGIAVLVTHRPAGLACVDQVAVMAAGRIHALGPRDEMLAAMTRRQGVPPLRPVPAAAPAPAAAGPVPLVLAGP